MTLNKVIKIGAKVVSRGRYVIFQMAEVAIAWQMSKSPSVKFGFMTRDLQRARTG